MAKTTIGWKVILKRSRNPQYYPFTESRFLNIAGDLMERYGRKKARCLVRRCNVRGRITPIHKGDPDEVFIGLCGPSLLHVSQ